ncbi:Uncharacterised protein [Raoultella planticola]|jgi:hypothetical protein|uniref:Uncharacterized protein n=1 Tax=Raoultella planticola TaxID=575 RepID=A0A8G2E8Y8_RAOPL|nr:hypothetical protein DFO76_101452 [Raoultella planticola]TDX41049.1 hypothetical protein DET60_101448 [Raoultella planticola]SBM37201.1 Uncharacterised protein [Raoultella planticola]SPZ25551.1 Uncharacterised protein [Raoultella planticola]VTM70478.1 Uncharacterised protein [Raoultella planticola]
MTRFTVKIEKNQDDKIILTGLKRRFVDRVTLR